MGTSDRVDVWGQGEERTKTIPPGAGPPARDWRGTQPRGGAGGREAGGAGGTRRGAGEGRRGASGEPSGPALGLGSSGGSAARRALFRENKEAAKAEALEYSRTVAWRASAGKAPRSEEEKAEPASRAAGKAGKRRIKTRHRGAGWLPWHRRQGSDSRLVLALLQEAAPRCLQPAPPTPRPGAAPWGPSCRQRPTSRWPASWTAGLREPAVSRQATWSPRGGGRKDAPAWEGPRRPCCGQVQLFLFFFDALFVLK